MPDDLNDLIHSILHNIKGAISEDMRALAREVVSCAKEQDSEDSMKAWAEKLAASVAELED